MGVDTNCYIKGYYIDDRNKVEKIVEFKDHPAKWSQTKQNYWNAYVDFILRNEYYYKDFYVIVEHRSSDYGVHSIEIFKNTVSIFDAETDDHDQYAKWSKFCFRDDKIIVLYRKSTNDFKIDFQNESKNKS